MEQGPRRAANTSLCGQTVVHKLHALHGEGGNRLLINPNFTNGLNKNNLMHRKPLPKHLHHQAQVCLLLSNFKKLPYVASMFSKFGHPCTRLSADPVHKNMSLDSVLSRRSPVHNLIPYSNGGCRLLKN
jgi:hypothetical protein